MMFSKSFIAFVAVSVLSFSTQVSARERWLERDNKPVFLHPRRFGQENPPVLQKLSAACPGQVCGVLAGQAVTPLLAAQGECTQQDLADAIIDASKQFDATTQANMIAIAKEYRQAEKNTPPDFTTNPPANRNSVFCQKAPKNPELNGLVQAQDPANDPNLFFDPATQATVKKGTQANTSPFGGAAAPVNGTAAVATPATRSVTAGSSAIGNFGKCSVPQIEFGAGFDGRKETSFQPVDKVSFNHGSAQAVGIITQFICDTLTNTCGADATAKATCAKGQAAAAAAPPKTGADADAFNAAFGIKTNFAAVTAIDDQGNAIAGSTTAPAAGGAASASGNAASAATGGGSAASAPAASTPAAGAASGIGNFGSCSVPQIEFGDGFDGRKETSFQPVDKKSFNHGSAQNIGIISQFICDTLTNSCGADATAKATCAKAQAAAAAAAPKTGADADAFNAAFGIKTKFSAIPAVDDQGNVIAGSATGAAAGAAPAAGNALNTSTGAATGAPAAGGIGNFGSCSVPQIEFGAGFDGRKETSFQPVDKKSFNHGSAQNIGIISQFICDTLTNTCGADATAKATCAKGQAAAAAASPETGADADAFNAAFGIKTNFKAVAAIDDQGRVVA